MKTWYTTGLFMTKDFNGRCLSRHATPPYSDMGSTVQKRYNNWCICNHNYLWPHVPPNVKPCLYISFGPRKQNYRAIKKELPVSHVDINIKISASWFTKLGKQNYTNIYMINIIHTTKLSSVCSSFATTARRAQAVNWFFCRLLKHCKKILESITNRIPFKISTS